MVCRLEGYFFNDLLTSSYARSECLLLAIIRTGSLWHFWPPIFAGKISTPYALIERSLARAS